MTGRERDLERDLALAVAAAVPAEEALLLAVSGGGDSVAMLGAAAGALPRRRLAVCHVDHGARPGSGADADHVRRLCASLDLPFWLRAVGGPPAGETELRHRRLAALADAARAAGARWILLAHHLDDALETLALHLLRGHRGARAHAAIPTVTPLGDDLALLRPFLRGARPPRRDDLRRHRERRGLPAVDDPTNRDTAIPRNAVRAALAEGRPPLTFERLAALRRAGRARVQAQVTAAADALERSLRPEGSGCRLDREALHGARHAGELLRLLGASLARPRRVRVRRTVVDELGARCRSGAGRWTLPADPAPIEVRLSSAGLHLPHEPLPAGPPAARTLGAVMRTSQYL